MECITIEGRSFAVLQHYLPELYAVEDCRSKLKYTAKYITELSETRKRRILQEIKILKNVQILHPSILSLHFSIFSHSSCLILYEFCCQGLLSHKFPLAPLKIMHFLCLGLTLLHSKSYIHNNLSINTVFLSNNIPKIAGLEHIAEEELLMDVSSSVDQDSSGFSLYRAPEQLEGQIPSKQADIWSLGQIFYHMLTKESFTGAVPEHLPTQYKDLILMTLDRNPLKRASLQAIIKKIEERQSLSPRVVRGCGCFPSKRLFFSSGNSTTGLVRKVTSNDFQTSDKYFKRLIKKVWDTPGKIIKFYNEILVQEFNDESRLRLAVVLFMYLQRAPVSAFSTSPGILEVIKHIEENLKPSSRARSNELFFRLSHIMTVLIRSKFYIVNSHLLNFNGIFVSVSSSIKKFSQEPQVQIVKDLLNYWEQILAFHEHLILLGFNSDPLKFIRKVLAEEQSNLVDLIKILIEVRTDEFSAVHETYLSLLEKAKNAFSIDNLTLSLPSEEILISEHFKSANQSLSKRSYASGGVRFTPVQLEDDNDSPVSKKFLSLVDEEKYDSEDYEKQLEDIKEKFRIWNINSQELSLIKSIGKGGSCEVWLGLYQKTQVAIKRQITKQQKNLKEFEREVNFLVNIRHPNLLTFMGICLEDPLSVVTEYCCGGTLFSLLHNRKDVFISWAQKLTILKEIAKGMLFLHSRNFIHRDLKSLNILLNNEVSKPNDLIQLKISDFGLTREIDLEEMMTGKIGTSHWMAPEVLSSSKYSARADVYSYSIVMYEVITREVPYKGKRQEEIRTQVLMNRLRPDLKNIPPNCSTKLITLMTLCWKEDAEKRPSFSSILDLLNGISL